MAKSTPEIRPGGYPKLRPLAPEWTPHLWTLASNAA